MENAFEEDDNNKIAAGVQGLSAVVFREIMEDNSGNQHRLTLYEFQKNTR